MPNKAAPAAKTPDDKAEPVVLPALTQAQLDRLDKIDFEIPRAKALRENELEGLCRESLEAYHYGRRARYDSQGHDWQFFREADNDAFYLAVSVSIAGIELAASRVPLHRVAGKEGEDAMIDLVLALHQQALLVQCAVLAEQAKRLAARAANPNAVYGEVELGPQLTPPAEGGSDA